MIGEDDRVGSRGMLLLNEAKLFALCGDGRGQNRGLCRSRTPHAERGSTSSNSHSHFRGPGRDERDVVLVVIHLQRNSSRDEPAWPGRHGQLEPLRAWLSTLVLARRAQVVLIAKPAPGPARHHHPACTRSPRSALNTAVFPIRVLVVLILSSERQAFRALPTIACCYGAKRIFIQRVDWGWL